jgi:hypothetical protein
MNSALNPNGVSQVKLFEGSPYHQGLCNTFARAAWIAAARCRIIDQNKGAVIAHQSPTKKSSSLGRVVAPPRVAGIGITEERLRSPILRRNGCL